MFRQLLTFPAVLGLLLVLTLAPVASAQDASDLFLVVLDGEGGGVSLWSPIQLTNRDGYDNQPAFSADGSKLFYTAMQTDAEGQQQSDIWQIELGGDSMASTPKPFRQTPESEYSPTPIPGDDALSVIRVEADGRQRLWRLPLDTSQPASVILPDVEPVGYHAWSADARELVLFVLDEPHRLVRVSFDDAGNPGEARTVSADIGRSLHRIPGRDAFSFIDKSTKNGDSGKGGTEDGGWRIASLSIDGDRIQTLAPALDGREDVAFRAPSQDSGDPELWGGDGTRLLRAKDHAWREVADLGRWGVSGITRIAFDATGQRLALVAQRLPEPARKLDIVERAIEHHGGALFTSSETTLRQCSRSGCSKVSARLDGGLYVYDVTGERRGEPQRVRVSNDSLELWRAGEAIDVDTGSEDAQRLRDWVMARVYFPFLPYRLDDASVWKQDLGVESWGGRALHKVRVLFDPDSSTDADDVYLYWFDAETAELVQFAYSYSGDPGGLRFRVLENPRRVGGLLFHDQKNYGTEGPDLTVLRLTPESVRGLRLVSTVTFDEISVNELESTTE